MSPHTYLSEHEARELIAGRVPATVVKKLEAKLAPPAPMSGQTDILTMLEEDQEDGDTDRSSPRSSSNSDRR